MAIATRFAICPECRGLTHHAESCKLKHLSIQEADSYNEGKEQSEMKMLVESILKMLVDNPDKIEVTEIKGEGSTTIEIRVDQSDIGKIIGKQGRNANAIRTLTNAAGMKLKHRFHITILEGAKP